MNLNLDGPFVFHYWTAYYEVHDDNDDGLDSGLVGDLYVITMIGNEREKS